MMYIDSYMNSCYANSVIYKGSDILSIRMWIHVLTQAHMFMDS